MTDDRRHPSRSQASRSRRVAVAGAVQGPGDPQITETTLDPSTTEATVPGSDTTETTEATESPDTTDSTVAATTDPTVGTDDEGAEVEGTESEHPENHGKDVSEAAHDHSHDEEAGNHGAYVSGVARDKGTTSTTVASSGAETSSGGHGRRGR